MKFCGLSHFSIEDRESKIGASASKIGYRKVKYPKYVGCETKYLKLKPGSNDSFHSVDMAIQRDFTVGVRKRGLMV